MHIYFTFLRDFITIRGWGCFHKQQLWKNRVRSTLPWRCGNHVNSETEYFQKAVEWVYSVYYWNTVTVVNSQPLEFSPCWQAALTHVSTLRHTGLLSVIHHLWVSHGWMDGWWMDKTFPSTTVMAWLKYMAVSLRFPLCYRVKVHHAFVQGVAQLQQGKWPSSLFTLFLHPQQGCKKESRGLVLVYILFFPSTIVIPKKNKVNSPNSVLPHITCCCLRLFLRHEKHEPGPTQGFFLLNRSYFLPLFLAFSESRFLWSTSQDLYDLVGVKAI